MKKRKVAGMVARLVGRRIAGGALAGAAGGALAAVGATVAGVRMWRRRRRAVPSSYAVTVNRPLEELSGDGRLTGRLAQLSHQVDLDLRRAPGGRGTEIRTSIRGHGWRVRRELREAKQELEAGEVLRLRPLPEARSAKQRRATEAMDVVLARGGQR